MSAETPNVVHALGKMVYVNSNQYICKGSTGVRGVVLSPTSVVVQLDEPIGENERIVVTTNVDGGPTVINTHVNGDAATVEFGFALNRESFDFVVFRSVTGVGDVVSNINNLP